MADLSAVPLLVLEKVRNKWWDITDPGDKRIHRMCAMCFYVGDMSLSPFNQCRKFCPIRVECGRLIDTRSRDWPDYRDEFLDMIIAEIERRANV